jgi:cell division protein ZapB
MTNAASLDQIADKVDRLLLRHDELQHTNTQLTEALLAITAERDSLRSRLAAARARIDTLLDRLPAHAPQAPEEPGT